MAGPAQAAGPAMATFASFLAFHRELTAVRRLVQSARLDTDTGPVDDETDVLTLPVTGDLRFEAFARLRGAIAGDQASGGPGQGGSSLAGGPLGDPRADPRYVMAALADETMLHQVSWPGRAWWADNLLEEQLFQSRICGEEIFRLGRDVVEGRLPGRADLAMAILLALSLGFRGRYRGLEDGGRIDGLRRRLYDIIFQRPPPRGIDWQAAMPNPATLTLAAGGRWRRTRVVMRPWTFAIIAVVVGYLVITHIVWHTNTDDLLTRASMIASPPTRAAAP